MHVRRASGERQYVSLPCMPGDQQNRSGSDDMPNLPNVGFFIKLPVSVKGRLEQGRHTS